MGAWGDSQTSEADVVLRWLVYLHFRRVAMCGDMKAGGANQQAGSHHIHPS